MKQVLKQLGIDKHDPTFITAATETKSKSAKKLGEIIFITVLAVIGFLALFVFITLIPTMIEQFKEAQTFKEYIPMIIAYGLFYPFLALIIFFTLAAAWQGLNAKPSWYLALFNNRLIFKEYDHKSNKYKAKTIPLHDIKKAIILKTEHVNFVMVKTRSFESVHYKISVHLAYEDIEETKYIHLLHADGFKELNEILSFLQNRQEVPIFYTYAPGEKYNYVKRDEHKLIFEFEQEPLNFKGYLEDFKEDDFIRKVNYFKAMESSSQYMKEKEQNKNDSS